MTKHFIPIFVEASGMRVIVFGGGNVALRKCKYFRGSEMTVVSKEVLPELESMATEVIIREIPEDVRQMIDSYDLVIAATDSRELNDRIRDDAIFMGIDVNSAHGGGNFLIPSVLERDGYTVAVSSGGRAPVFPPFLIKELDRLLDEKYDRMLELMADLREYALKNISPQTKRREYLGSVIRDADVQKAVAEGDMALAKELALKKVPRQ